jgi:hypothetical protein
VRGSNELYALNSVKVRGSNGALRSQLHKSAWRQWSFTHWFRDSSLKEIQDPWLRGVEADLSRNSEILVATTAAQLNSAAHE